MKSICLINVWIGELPTSFPLWRMSAEKNHSVDFYIITDRLGMEDSENIHFVSMSFDEIRRRFQTLFPFRIKMKTAYKLCDYKPIFGLVFPEITKNYEFWGHIDLDMILGDIRTFLTEDILNSYDKILEAGCFVLYRNNAEMNNLYLRSMEKDNMAYPYKRAFRCNYACYFDEYMGMNILGWKYCNVLRDQTEEKIVQDFSWQKLEFCSYITGEQFLFQWKDGHLFRYLCDPEGRIIDGQEPREYMLVHIQKRKMDITFSTDGQISLREIWIVPNKYLKDRPEGALYSHQEQEIYQEEIRKQDRQRSIRNMKKYGLIDYIPHFLLSRKIRKWIINEKKFF